MQAYEIQSHVYNKHYSKFEEIFVEEDEDATPDIVKPIPMTLPSSAVKPQEDRKYLDIEVNDQLRTAIKSEVNGKYYCGVEIVYGKLS